MAVGILHLLLVGGLRRMLLARELSAVAHMFFIVARASFPRDGPLARKVHRVHRMAHGLVSAHRGATPKTVLAWLLARIGTQFLRSGDCAAELN